MSNEQNRSYPPLSAHELELLQEFASGILTALLSRGLLGRPIVHRVSELLRAGIVVNPKTTHTVFNSQNTAVIRELAPAFFMVPQWGRYDDIFASLMVQRLMRERGLVTHFGQPFVWQQRNAHDLLKRPSRGTIRRRAHPRLHRMARRLRPHRRPKSNGPDAHPVH